MDGNNRRLQDQSGSEQWPAHQSFSFQRQFYCLDLFETTTALETTIAVMAA